ncbi:hypothetical protein JW968_03290, partial [Candidatus Woesearchaeota archaeon]|nr:hypothetical protein [Candidatus Woesearchaeota archaeon]
MNKKFGVITILICCWLILATAVSAYPVTFRIHGNQGPFHTYVDMGGLNHYELYGNPNQYSISGSGSMTIPEFDYDECFVSHAYYNYVDGSTGNGPWNYNVDFAKESNCHSNINSMSLSDYTINLGESVVVYVTVDSVFDFHAGGPQYAPMAIQQHYSNDVRVEFYVNSETVPRQVQTVNVGWSSSNNVQFTFTPGETGTYSLKIRTIVRNSENCECSGSSEDIEVRTLEVIGDVECYNNADCFDFNPCTDDVCMNPGTANSYCQYYNNNDPCNDGQWCTVNDQCSGGWCQGSARDCGDAVSCTVDTCNEALDRCDHNPDNALCNDNNVCTNDVCSLVQGCIYSFNSNPCNDGQWCTVNDYCSVGSCHSGNARNCADMVNCTVDSCNEAQDRCDHLPNNDLCDDNDICTADSCDIAKGCLYMSVPNDCGSFECGDSPSGCYYCGDCPPGEVCINGYCEEEEIECYNDADCADSNVCTDDACINPGTPQSYCQYTNNNDPCNDGQWCTVNDYCSGGSCHSGPARDCFDGVSCTVDSCNEVQDICDHTPDNALCNDDNICTDDVCHVILGCQYNNNNDPCSDGQWCTINDQCAGGSCQSGPARDCSDAVGCTVDTCNEIFDRCDHNPNDALCDDQDICTVDNC